MNCDPHCYKGSFTGNIREDMWSAGQGNMENSAILFSLKSRKSSPGVVSTSRLVKLSSSLLFILSTSHDLMPYYVLNWPLKLFYPGVWKAQSCPGPRCSVAGGSSHNQMVEGSIPSQGAYLGCPFILSWALQCDPHPGLGASFNRCLFLPSLSLSLKKQTMKNVIGWE